MVQIKEVIPQEDYLLEVILNNGSSISLNMKSRLNTVRFRMLADQEFFRKVTSDGRFVSWGDEVEISVSEVFQLAQK
ncbi:DUF2442 domain-containing protein [Desulfosporosinus meridiei]|uniref:DUF2442 domain-containing protein n=1 Tax=Desulfosporosinus meridiei (strain ATCC BAA-275 / DSM 13257 / KCTC 12902 / NCIMB 13706 / S10) TaxID=768704 RepID=J7IRP7_DESMD|nr:DUF2442 domain-containing protein [Desulfosporosinus meridiei]AFQ44310.1 Protein of unknown function (DUF2442) [Desulfosporosinus meridiei DSM 13257]